MKDKINYVITLIEQLAKNGFVADAPKIKNERHIADISYNGITIAHITRDDTLDINPSAEIDGSIIDELREIYKRTLLLCRSADEMNFFSDVELLTIHTSLVKVRIMTDSGLTSNQARFMDTLIMKIEGMVSGLAGLNKDAEGENEPEEENTEGEGYEA